jgi:hypothetical protein
VSDIGVALMRKAFDKSTGPLTDMSNPEAEREALAHLFAGAIGSYKNPHSHRTVNLTMSEAEWRTPLDLAACYRLIDNGTIASTALISSSTARLCCGGARRSRDEPITGPHGKVFS